MSPGDLGEVLKPFVFLDLFDTQGGSFSGFGGRSRGFQLWIALPPEHELGPVESIYQAPKDNARAGPALVLIGAHGGAASTLKAPSSMNYLAVRLKAGESWRYQPAHTVAWMASASGRLATPERVDAGELVVFEPTNAAIDFYAETDSEFVLGSAESHPYELVLGYYSAHTSPASLQAGEQASPR
jgi:redox-sensitive bicupin YhaK (pirin superfamily)